MNNNDSTVPDVFSELNKLMYPLSKRARHKMEQALRNSETPVSIRLWNDYPVDGYEQYDFCVQNGIPVTVETMRFKNLDDAIVYVCATQIERDDLSIQFRKYLLGKLYASEIELSRNEWIRINGQTRVPLCTFYKYTAREVDITRDPAGREWTSSRLGQAYNISHVSIRKYKRFAGAVDALREKDAEMADIVLSGISRLSFNEVIRLADMDTAEIVRFRNKWLQECKPYRQIEKTVTVPRNEEEEPPKPAEKSIKDMPDYDPDAEASMLIFTIPSWCSSLERFLRTDHSVISEKARETLLREVQTLQDKTLELQIEMEE